MKKLIITLTTIVIAVIATTNFTYATTKTNAVTVLSNIGAINKIEVRGNVEVNISNGSKDEVTVNNNYYAESAFVQDKDGVLRISSYKAEKLVVYVTVNDLRTIAAYDNAVVKSDGRFAAIELNVNLYNNAYAGLNLDNYAANITVNDNAKADLKGYVTEYSLTYSNSSTVNRTELAAMNATETKTIPVQVVKQQAASVDDVVTL